VLFAIDIASRKVEVLGISVNPWGAWMHNALIVADEAMNGTGKVIRRDRLGGVLGSYHREAA